MAKQNHPFYPDRDWHESHQAFLDALQSQSKVELLFFSKEDGRQLTRTCAPMDFGPSRKAADSSNRYHFWDYDSDTKTHTLSLKQEQVRSMTVLDEKFNPAEFITWSTQQSPWYTTRNWGQFS